jgi:hypothetical protein
MWMLPRATYTCSRPECRCDRPTLHVAGPNMQRAGGLTVAAAEEADTLVAKRAAIAEGDRTVCILGVALSAGRIGPGLQRCQRVTVALFQCCGAA